MAVYKRVRKQQAVWATVSNRPARTMTAKTKASSVLAAREGSAGGAPESRARRWLIKEEAIA